jgi:hypothetical protein
MMKRFIKVAMLLCVITVLLSVLSLKTVGAKAAPLSRQVSQNRLSSNACQWNVVPSPHPNSNSGLSSVVAVSATDVWAVGHADSNPLIENYHC